METRLKVRYPLAEGVVVTVSDSEGRTTRRLRRWARPRRASDDLSTAMALNYISASSSQTDYSRTHTALGKSAIKALAVTSANSANVNSNLSASLTNVSDSDVSDPAVAIRANSAQSSDSTDYTIYFVGAAALFAIILLIVLGVKMKKARDIRVAKVQEQLTRLEEQTAWFRKRFEEKKDRSSLGSVEWPDPDSDLEDEKPRTLKSFKRNRIAPARQMTITHAPPRMAPPPKLPQPKEVAESHPVSLTRPKVPPIPRGAIKTFASSDNVPAASTSRASSAGAPKVIRSFEPDPPRSRSATSRPSDAELSASSAPLRPSTAESEPSRRRTSARDRKIHPDSSGNGKKSSLFQPPSMASSSTQRATGELPPTRTSGPMKRPTARQVMVNPAEGNVPPPPSALAPIRTSRPLKPGAPTPLNFKPPPKPTVPVPVRAGGQGPTPRDAKPMGRPQRMPPSPKKKGGQK